MHQFHNLSTNLYDPYSLGFLCFFILLIAINLFLYRRPNPRLENYLFSIFACLLIAFSVLRPIGIARDDLNYQEISKQICTIGSCFELINYGRDWGWYLLVGTLKWLMSGERAILLISGVGVSIQLLIINRLCRSKLLALTLFIPLVYLYYDFTFLRAGMALTAFFLGFYFLTISQRILASGIFLGSFIFHSQGVFSIGIIPFHKIARYKYISIAAIFLLIACIYLQWTPSIELLSLFSKNESSSYWLQYQSGLFSDEKKFPVAHLLIIGYVTLILFVNKSSVADDISEQYVLASILFAVFLAWLFAPIHAIQTRLFDFYLAPLVFLVGNLRPTRINLFFTLTISAILYIRMELFHNWIVG